MSHQQKSRSYMELPWFDQTAQNTKPRSLPLSSLLCNCPSLWDKRWVTSCFPFSYRSFTFSALHPPVSTFISFILLLHRLLRLARPRFHQTIQEAWARGPALAVLLGVEQKRINSQRERRVYRGCVNQVFVPGYRQRCKRRRDLHGFVLATWYSQQSKKERGLDSEIYTV